jgi:hypothetical protein
VPCIGGGTKLIRTLRAGGAIGLTAGAVGSCADAKSAVSAKVIATARSRFPVIPSEVEESLTVSYALLLNCKRCLDSARHDNALNVIAPVHIWEKIVAPFAIAEEFVVQIVRDKLIVQAIESRDVIGRSFRRVLARRSGFHQKRPIARLREQEFARELLEHAIGLFTLA